MTQGRYCLDANIFITAWNESYPPMTFPSLWQTLSDKKEDFILIAPIFEEITPVSKEDNRKLTEQQKKEKYPLRMWLQEHDFTAAEIRDDIRDAAFILEKEYQIKTMGNGANSNDILLIAYARQYEKTVVTFEKRQPQKPTSKSNYKIPLICQKERVDCIDFIQMIQNMGITV